MCILHLPTAKRNVEKKNCHLGVTCLQGVELPAGGAGGAAGFVDHCMGSSIQHCTHTCMGASIQHCTHTWMGRPFSIVPTHAWVVHLVLYPLMGSSILYCTHTWGRPFCIVPTHGVVHLVLYPHRGSCIQHCTHSCDRPFNIAPTYAWGRPFSIVPTHGGNFYFQFVTFHPVVLLNSTPPHPLIFPFPPRRV